PPRPTLFPYTTLFRSRSSPKSGGAGFAGAGSGLERRLDGAHQRAEAPALPAPGAGMSHGAKVWVALATVYVIWGSTYLGIELTGDRKSTRLNSSHRTI